MGWLLCSPPFLSRSLSRSRGLACRELLARRPRRKLSSASVAAADIASGVAAVAALLTVYYARATVSEARKSRQETSLAHTEEMSQEAQLLEATTTAHEQEMAERADALARELWLQRLTQLGKVQELLGEAVRLLKPRIQRSASGSSGAPRSWASARLC